MSSPLLRWYVPLRTREGKAIPWPIWPDGWSVPRVGDYVHLGDSPELRLTVKYVEWHPNGDGKDRTPFVHVVLE